MPVTNYIWDGENCLAETDGSDVVQTIYTYEPEQYGNLISSRVSGTTYYHHYDALGSTRQLSIAAGAVSDTWTYDAWGNIVARTGVTSIFLQWVGQVGYYYDPETATFWIRKRPISPTNARWTTADPAEFVDGLNRYSYVNGNPIGYVDPSGLFEDDPTDFEQISNCAEKKNPCTDEKACCTCILYAESRGSQACYQAILCIMQTRQGLIGDKKWGPHFKGEKDFCSQAETTKVAGVNNAAYRDCCADKIDAKPDQKARDNAEKHCKDGCDKDPTDGAQYWFADEKTAKKVLKEKNIGDQGAKCKLIKIEKCSQVFYKCETPPLA